MDLTGLHLAARESPSAVGGQTVGKRTAPGFGSPTRWIKRFTRFFRRKFRGKATTKGERREDKRFHLHLGVHKTGTTYTQTVFKINQDRLRQAGVLYWDLAYTRENLTPFLVGLSRRRGALPPAKCRERIASLIHAPEVASAERVVISDENLLGFINEIVRKKGYKGLVRRLAPIRGAFDRDVRVFLTIRNYADFISSMYCELVTTKPYFPFQQIRDGKFISELSWLRVYQDLVKVFGRKNVMIYEYKDFFSKPGDYLSSLAGAGIDFEFPGKEIRTSPSAKAIEFIAVEGAAHPELPVRKIVERANRRFPRNAENPPFDPWTPEERLLLEERYRKDIAAIPCWNPGRHKGE